MKVPILPVTLSAIATVSCSACYLAVDEFFTSGDAAVILSVLPGQTKTLASSYAYAADIPGGARQLVLTATSPPGGVGGQAECRIEGGFLSLSSIGDCEVEARVRYDAGGLGLGSVLDDPRPISPWAVLWDVTSDQDFDWTFDWTFDEYGWPRTTSMTVEVPAYWPFPEMTPYALDGMPGSWADVFSLEFRLALPAGGHLRVDRLQFVPEPASGVAVASVCLVAVALRKWRSGRRLEEGARRACL